MSTEYNRKTAMIDRRMMKADDFIREWIEADRIKRRSLAGFLAGRPKTIAAIVLVANRERVGSSEIHKRAAVEICEHIARDRF